MDITTDYNLIFETVRFQMIDIPEKRFVKFIYKQLKYKWTKDHILYLILE